MEKLLTAPPDKPDFWLHVEETAKLRALSGLQFEATKVLVTERDLAVEGAEAAQRVRDWRDDVAHRKR